MFTFNDKTREFLEEISREFRKMARNRDDFSKVDFPYMESMAVLLHNLATIDEPLSGIEDYCKRIIEGANYCVQIELKKQQDNESAEGSRK